MKKAGLAKKARYLQTSSRRDWSHRAHDEHSAGPSRAEMSDRGLAPALRRGNLARKVERGLRKKASTER